MTNLKAFLGNPIDFRGICYVFPPKVKDMINLENYNMYQKIMTISQEEIYDATHSEALKNEAP